MNKRILFLFLVISGVLLTGCRIVEWVYTTEYRYVNDSNTSVSIYHISTDHPSPSEEDTLLIATIEPGEEFSLFFLTDGSCYEPPTQIMEFPYKDGYITYFVDAQILLFGNGTEVVHTYDSNDGNAVFQPSGHNICDKNSYVLSEVKKERLRVYTYTFTDADCPDIPANQGAGLEEPLPR